MEIVEIPIQKISAESHSQRLNFDEEKMSGLVLSISSDGLVQPLRVKEDGDGYTLVFGHRRLEALKRLGWHTVPCIISKGDEVSTRRETFVENFFSENLTPVELAVAIADEFQSKRMTIEQLAFGFKKTTEWVRRQIAICGWPEDVLEGIHTGKLSIAAASNLACITEEYYRKMLVRQAVENGATARTTSAWLQAWEAMLPPEEAMAQDPVDPDAPAVPMVPQGPCLVCHDVYRLDELSHVPLCSHCIKVVSTVGQQV